MKCDGLAFVLEFDFNDILHAGLVDPEARLVSIGLDHELKALAKFRAAFFDRPSSRDGAGNLLDPRDVLSVGTRLDDGMV